MSDVQRLGGAKKLSLLDAIAQSVGFMGPVFSIAFLVPLLVGVNAAGRGAGTAVPLAVLIAAVGVLGLGWIVAQYTKRIHAAGSLYDYVTDGLGRRVGGAAGTLYYVGILALGGGILIMTAGTIYDTLLGEYGIEPLPELGWNIVLFLFVAVILYFGVALSTRAQLILALVSIAVVLVFFISVIVQVGGDNDIAKGFDPNGSPDGWVGIMFAVLFGVLLFTGFETSANLGEETANPKRDIPRAVLISVIAIAGFYVIGTYSQIAGYGFSIEAISGSGAPLFGLAGPADEGGFGSTLIRRVLEIVVILDMLAVLLGCAVAASRGIFAMSRDHRFPPVLAKVSKRGTPGPASVVTLVVFAVVIYLVAFVPDFVAIPELPHYVAVFSFLSTLGGFSLAIIYFLLSLGALRGLADHPKKVLLYLSAVVGLLVTGGAIFGSVYNVAEPASYAVITAIVVLVIGFILAFVFPGRQTAVTDFSELAPGEARPQKL